MDNGTTRNTDNTTIVKELDNTPVGKWGIRKRLTKTTDENGDTTYSIREYAPRPIYRNGKETNHYYVSSRGIDLSENELKNVCALLRHDLYMIRHFGDNNAEDYENDNIDDDANSEEEPIAKEIDNSDEETIVQYTDEEINFKDEDPVIDGDFEYECDCCEEAELLWFDRADGTHVRMGLMSWHGGITMYDIHEYRRRLNTRGYEEYYPEIDKGISLEDAECEHLCQGVESLFPDFADGVSRYREDNWDKNMNTVLPGLTTDEYIIAEAVVSEYIDYMLKDGMLRDARGSEIGSLASHDRFEKLRTVKRKLNMGERMTPAEIDMCKMVLVEQTPNETTDERKRELREIISKFIDKSVKCSNGPSHDFYMSEKRICIDASEGEFSVAVKLMEMLCLRLFDGNIVSPKWEQFLDRTDKLIMEDIEKRNRNRIELSQSYKIEPTKHFLEDFIVTIQRLLNDDYPSC